jgi:hypothetical protein
VVVCLQPRCRLPYVLRDTTRVLGAPRGWRHGPSPHGLTAAVGPHAPRHTTRRHLHQLAPRVQLRTRAVRSCPFTTRGQLVQIICPRLERRTLGDTTVRRVRSHVSAADSHDSAHRVARAARHSPARRCWWVAAASWLRTFGERALPLDEELRARRQARTDVGHGGGSSGWQAAHNVRPIRC